MPRHGHPSNDRPLVFVRRTASLSHGSLRFPHAGASPSSHLAPSRSLPTELASRPFFLQHERTTCGSRAHFHRTCAHSLLPCATRAARVLRTKSRRSPPGSSAVSFSPLQRTTPRALAHPLVTLLSLVAHGRRRPCRAPLARSRSRVPRAFSSSCCACATQSTHPLPPFFDLLYPPARSRRDGASATSIAFSILVLIVSRPFFPHHPPAFQLHFSFQLAHCSFSVARALARLFLIIFLNFSLSLSFGLSHPIR